MSNELVTEFWEGAEEWEQLAYELCIEDGHDEESAHDLIWDGGPIPEPWGERWQKYEYDAKRMINLVRKYVPPVDSLQSLRGVIIQQQAEIEHLKELFGCDPAYYEVSKK